MRTMVGIVARMVSRRFLYVIFKERPDAMLGWQLGRLICV